jgi:hypothetical protein
MKRPNATFGDEYYRKRLNRIFIAAVKKYRRDHWVFSNRRWHV